MIWIINKIIAYDMDVKSNNTIFPIDRNFLKNELEKNEINLQDVSIRELNQVVNNLSSHFDVDYLRFEFGIPGLIPNKIGFQEEIRILKNKYQLAGVYPPFDGIPELKQSAAKFVKNFLNVEVSDKSCIPTVGAMHGGFICQSIAGRLRPESDTILYLDPGFPVNKIQTKFLGLKEDSIDLYSYRGNKLRDKIEERISKGNVGGILWSSPNNPSWVCLKEKELESIGNLLTKYDLKGIEDAAYLGMDYRYDYSVPGRKPFIPTIANYTKNYFIIISSSKIFSYAGQRIAITIISPGLLDRRYSNLQKYYNTSRVGHAFIHGGIYPTTAGVPQTPQFALAALFEAANNGTYSFLKEVKIYSERAKHIKKIFLENGFQLVYEEDMGEPIGDGFYFTVSKPRFTGDKLLFEMLRYGMAGIPLSTTGSTREGIRICVSLIKDNQISLLKERLALMNNSISSASI